MHRFAVALAGATLFLLFVGAMVTSTGSGLATPDWPLPEGRLLPPMKGEMLFEHGHRLVAAAVGLMTIVLAVWLILREERGWVRALGIAALAAVVGQGLLGMLTVRLGLSPPVSIAHAALSQLFFAMTVTLALVTSRGWKEGVDEAPVGGPALALAIAVYLQIAAGALFRHTGGGLAYHLFGAAIVAILAIRLTMGAAGASRRIAWTILGLLTLQLLLGAGSLTLVSVGGVKTIDAPVAKALLLSLHLAAAAAILGLALILTLRGYRSARIRESESLLAGVRP
jgi:cytochrome c oxidase assembly protein subunit 15